MNTSYYGRASRHPKAVAISQGVPKWYNGRVYKDLAPPWWMIKISDPKKYTLLYKAKVLDLLDPQKVYEDLGEDAVLLCWEKPGEFCHRRIVAEWLEEKLGIKVPELEAELVSEDKEEVQEVKTDTIEQLTLFAF